MKFMILFFAIVMSAAPSFAQEFVDMTGTYSSSRGCNRGGFKYTLVFVEASSSSIVVTFDNPGADNSVFGPSFFTLFLGDYKFTQNNSPASHKTTISNGGTKVTSTTTVYGSKESTSLALTGDVLSLSETGLGRASRCSFVKTGNDVNSIPNSPFRRRRH
ncbi:MAG: hypothetical protein K2Q26_07975 [Bdellovibrionales bacterium]|nr:hypothetical protein [Bdellovibrionales bacterium]